MTLQSIAALLLLAAAPRPAAVVDGRSITDAEVAKATAERVRSTRFHRNLEPDQLRLEQRQALDDLIVLELRAQEARRRGLLPDPQVAQVASAEENAAGGPQAFERLLVANGIDRARYLEVISRPLLAARLEQAELAARLSDPTPAELRAAYDRGGDRYAVPEALRISELCLRVDPGGDAQAWADAKVRAEALRVKIAAGADFAAEARSAACDDFASTGGDLGLVHRGSLDPEMEKAAWALHDGETSPPLQSFRGWHLVRRVSTLPARRAAFAEVMASIRSELREARRREILEALDARLRAAATVAIREGT